jgi:pimeloyl-ACP methyl ester carboxylesterase
MLLNIGQLKNKILYAYSHYKNQIDTPAEGVDWLEDVISGIYTQVVGDDYYIVFRGTDPNKESSAANMRFAKHRLPYKNTNPKIWVHTGFIDLYDDPDCRDVLMRKVAEQLAANPNTRIWVLGHSQGAAIAQLCALDLQYQFTDEIKQLVCVPFSSPRLGNAAFVRSYNKRVVNSFSLKIGHDIVPRVPLWIMGYRQAGKILHFAPRNPLLILWNYIAGAVVMLVKGHKAIYDKYSPPMPAICSAAKGSDWYLFDDHSPGKQPEMTVNTDSLKKRVTKFSQRDLVHAGVGKIGI